MGSDSDGSSDGRSDGGGGVLLLAVQPLNIYSHHCGLFCDILSPLAKLLINFDLFFSSLRLFFFFVFGMHWGGYDTGTILIKALKINPADEAAIAALKTLHEAVRKIIILLFHSS